MCNLYYYKILPVFQWAAMGGKKQRYPSKILQNFVLNQEIQRIRTFHKTFKCKINPSNFPFKRKEDLKLYLQQLPKIGGLVIKK